MVDPVNSNSNVSGANYAKRTEGTGSVDNSDRPSQPNDQTVTTSHRPSGAEGQSDPYLDDFDADESAIGRAVFGGEAINPDPHTELIMTVRLTVHETVQELAENDEDMRVAAEKHMMSDADDRADSIRTKGKKQEVLGVTSAGISVFGAFAGGGYGAAKAKDGIATAQALNSGFDAVAGAEKSILNKGVTDEEADEAQLEADYNLDTSQTQHASAAFDSGMSTIRQIIRDGSDAMKEGEQAKRQEFKV